MTRSDLVDQLRTFWASLRRPAGVAPRPTRWAWASDILLAVTMAAVTLLAAARGLDFAHRDLPPLVGEFNPPIDYRRFPAGPIQLVYGLLATLPLAWRRRRPLLAFWLVLAGTRLFAPGEIATDAIMLTFAACVIAAYSAGVHSPYRRATALSILAGLIVVVTHEDGLVPALTPKVLPFLLLIGGALAANATGMWKQRVQTLEQQQADLTRQAVERERSRIAAELHDVVTHNVAVMVVQAGAARKILDTSPDLAREALLAVESGGRAAMAELRHVMGLLTMTSDAADPARASDPARTADLAPQPGLAQVPALTERLRAAGMELAVRVEGEPVALPSGPDLAAYRVVQEALTNAVKHAAGARVAVLIEYAADAVRVEVTDTGGTRTAAAAGGNGRGLAGLRERLAVYGGTLRAEKRVSGGYRVDAVVPLDATGAGVAAHAVGPAGGPGAGSPAAEGDGAAA